jgi:hypothetical protein
MALIDTGRVTTPARPGAMDSLDASRSKSRLITGHVRAAGATTLLVTLDPVNPGSDARFPSQCGGLSSYEAGAGGAMLIRYQAGNFTRELVTDLRAGAFALPPAERVIVDVWQWSKAGAHGGWTIGGALLDGTHPTPSRLTSTLRLGAVPAGATSIGTIPAGARWVSIWGGVSAALDPAFVEFYEESELGMGAHVVSDWGAGLHVPPQQPVELSRLAGGVSFRLVNRSAAEAYSMGCTFYLEP